MVARYLAMQLNAAARLDVAEMPNQMLAAGPLLARLAQEVPAKLGTETPLFV
ncbi:hypothetical protein [Mycobacterium uberis]|uniref:hypothetical protein n=1 Tax=Mycobacterium uberis TaxID=2162698 RepID=UPI001FB420AA|nr:hypothetical protein [Mycobacterium uberis]